MRIRVAEAAAPALVLPPPYSLVTLRESGDAFAHARRIAEECGAGTLVWVRRFDLVEFAVVLEPEEPLRSARRAFFAGMNAVADALASHCPPERALSFDWPDAVRLDGAVVGGGRLGWPDGTAEDEVPPWLVFAATLLAARVRSAEPDLASDRASLEEVGFDLGRPGDLVESFARHLLANFDLVAEHGWGGVAESYLARLPPAQAGDRRGLDVNGDLLTHGIAQAGPARRTRLLPHLERPSWSIL